MTVGIGTGGGLSTPSEEELAEYEQERPARRLGPALDLAISAWCAIISVGVLAQVFFPLPQGTQFYLVIFLAAVLPITLLVRNNMKDDVAEQLTKVAYDNMDALVAVNLAAKGITLDNAGKTDPVPLHPGAKKAIGGLK
jgi:hypothetical protein